MWSWAEGKLNVCQIIIEGNRSKVRKGVYKGGIKTLVPGVQAGEEVQP